MSLAAVHLAGAIADMRRCIDALQDATEPLERIGMFQESNMLQDMKKRLTEMVQVLDGVVL